MRALCLALSLVACVSLPRPTESRDLRGEVVRSATDRIGQRQLMLDGALLPADCFALPRVAFGEHGIHLEAHTPLELYRKLQREGHVFASTPRPGDLVFTRDLVPRRTMHVGLVGRVEPDGTITVYQRMAHGVEAYRMNPSHPHDGVGGGQKPWNDSIAAGNGETAPAGALFAAYATVLP